MATTLTNTTASVAVAQVGIDGVNLGTGASSKHGFYGKVPVVQRPYSSAVHATSALSVSTDFGATQLAWAQEVCNTFIGLGIWATV